MQYQGIGNLIMTIRKSKKLSQAKVCQSICSQKAVSNLELNEDLPNRLVLNALIERLGESPEYFRAIISEPEYEYFSWKMDVLEDIKMHNWDGALLKLEGKQDITIMEHGETVKLSNMYANRKLSEVLQEQFVLFWSSFIKKDTIGMGKAVDLTVKGYLDNSWMKDCISTTEMSMMLIHLSMFEDEQHLELIKMCLEYIEKEYSEKEQAKIYTKAVVQYQSHPKSNIIERIQYAQKGLELLRRHNRIDGMEEILEALAKDYSLVDTGKTSQYKEWLESFELVRNEYGQKRVEREGLFIGEVSQQIYLLSEVVRFHREEAECETKDVVASIKVAERTYKDIENGERDAHITTYQKIADELGIPYGKYSADVETNDFKYIKMAEKIQREIVQEHREEAYKLLEQMSEGLDLSIAENEQYVEMCKNIMAYRFEGRDRETFGNVALKCLQITIPGWDANYGTHFYTRTETSLLMNYLVSYRNSNPDKVEECLYILEKMWNVFSNSEVDSYFRLDEALLILATWKNILSDMGRLDEALEKADLGVRLCFKYDRGEKLPSFLAEKYENLKIKNEREIIFQASFCRAIRDFAAIYYRTADEKTMAREFESFNELK